MKFSAGLATDQIPRRGLSRWWPTLRIGLALSLLALLFYIANARDVLLVFANLRLIYIVYLLLLSLVLIWLSCLKWRLFVRAAGHDAPVLELMKIYTMSYFFNMFMPSSLGGDVARSVQLGQHLKNLTSAFAITFMERVTGFLAMTFLGVIFVILNVGATAGVEAAILVVAFLTFSGALVCFSERLSLWCFAFSVRVLKFIGAAGLALKLEALFQKLIESTAFARNNAPLFGRAMLYSFAFHFFAVVNTYVAALAIGWYDASFTSLFIVVPLVLLVSAAPITPSSIGIQEGAFIYFLKRIGSTSAEGLGVALILRAKNFITALAGGLIWLMYRPKTDPHS